MFTIGVFGCWGNTTISGSAPSTPTLSLTDNEDGTGFTVELVGADDGTVNTLYVAPVSGSFASEGSSWDSLDQMDVGADPGRQFVYVISTLGGNSSVSLVGTVVVTGGTPVAADDNIPVAVRAMKQTAVYWPVLGVDEFGQPTWDDPVEIDCRWETVREEFVNPDGDQEVSRAKLIVDRDMEAKAYLLLGDLDSVVDADDPQGNVGAWEVRLFRITPNFRGTRFLREVYL